jgi:hypothetical protein
MHFTTIQSVAILVASATTVHAAPNGPNDLIARSAEEASALSGDLVKRYDWVVICCNLESMAVNVLQALRPGTSSVWPWRTK